MDWPAFQPQPVFLNAVRPGRGRLRLSSEHPNRGAFYVQDGQGMLVPAAPAGGQPMYRSVSNQERPASVVIHNTHWDDHSPVRGHHRCGSHGREYYYEDHPSNHDHSPLRGHRAHSRGHHGHSQSPSPQRRHRAHSHGHHEHSRSPSPRYHDPVLGERLKKLEDIEKAEKEKAQRKAAEERKKLEDIEKKEKEKEARERFEEEKMLEAERKRRMDEEDKKRKDEWIEAWKHEQEQNQKKEEDKKKKEYEEFRERTIKTFGTAGYSEEAIEKILKKAEKAEKKRQTGHKGESKHTGDEDKQLMRPTYIKVHRKYMSTDTLDLFELPWEFDTDAEYIIIKKWINEHDQEELFRHTAKLREKKARKKIEDTAIELRKDHGKLLLVEKKGPGRSRSRSRSWIFT